MDDLTIVVGFVITILSNIFTMYSMINKLNHEIGELKGKVSSLDKTVNTIVKKMIINEHNQ